MADKVERKSLVDQVYNLILKKIQTRELVPGDRLNIEELAKAFDVSRTPVRETINRLIQEGFVEQKHNVGPSIVKLDEEQETDLIEANAYLFNIVIDTYHQLGRLDSLAADLEEVIEDQSRAYETQDDNSFHEASVQFHKIMIDYCTNHTIRECAKKTQNQINMCTFAYLATTENRKLSIQAHTEIKDALKSGEIEKAKALMEEHNKFSEIGYMKKKGS